jgi:hypothetical protein
MDPQRHREAIMLRINELAEKLADKDGSLPVEVEKEIDLIDRRLCVALGINFDAAPSAYAYD